MAQGKKFFLGFRIGLAARAEKFNTVLKIRQKYGKQGGRKRGSVGRRRGAGAECVRRPGACTTECAGSGQIWRNVRGARTQDREGVTLRGGIGLAALPGSGWLRDQGGVVLVG